MTTGHYITTLLTLGLFVLSGCGKPPEAADAPDRLESATADIDFLALFQSDPVEICLRGMTEMNAEVFGEGYITQEMQRLECQCMRDGAEAALQVALPDKPQLRAGLLQITVNFDVMGSLRHVETGPENFQAFYRFLNEGGSAQLGFTPEELDASVPMLKAAAEYMKTNPLALAALPSCSKLIALQAARFPEWDLADGKFGRERILALRRLEYDNTVDTGELDDILKNASLPEACQITLNKLCQSGRTSAWEVDVCNAAENTTLCDNWLEADASLFSDATPLTVEAAHRIRLADRYMLGRKFTAMAFSPDAYYYASYHEQRFGWPEGTVQLIAETLPETWPNGKLSFAGSFVQSIDQSVPYPEHFRMRRALN